MKSKHSVLTYSGRLLDLSNPNPNDLTIEDIAHGLSRQFRFGGALRDYTVAQHSVIVAKAVADNWTGGDGLMDAMKLAMLHDAPEAYIRDMPTPAKNLLPDYRVMEGRLMVEVFRAFDLKMDHVKLVTRADSSACGAEARIFAANRKDLDDLFPPVEVKIDTRLVGSKWSMGVAKDQFLRVWKRIHVPKANLKELDWP